MSHGEPHETIQMDGELFRGAGEHGRGWSEVRDQVPASIRDASFPTAVRGYDRRAVDTYVERVNRLIAEIEVSRSPAAAVRHALDRVGEQTSAILQRARSTAEEITTSAREEAEEITARAREEADEILADATDRADALLARSTGEAEDVVAQARAEAEDTLAQARAEAESTLSQARAAAAESLDSSRREASALREHADARVRELDAETAALTAERQKLVDDMRAMAARLAEVVSSAADFTPVEREVEVEAEPETTVAGEYPDATAVMASEEPSQAASAVEAPESGRGETSEEEPVASTPGN